ncbi:MAG TPA: S8 family serine peptidase, partial [Candidatus Baltobacteraceae bacterium]|nr:S8 family serine peptidase [Candidatus Baltobacteraceae bacterium]
SQEGARSQNSIRFDALGMRMRVVSVDPSRAQAFVAHMRAQSGVISVEQAQYRRLASAVSVNDPYYRGEGTGAPYFQSPSTAGQWDMHVINVGTAWGDYSSLPARGAAIAVIDTGVDVTHPDLGGGKVVHQGCFVTYPSSAAQTTGSFAIDTDGHGTNVAGIADADTNNNFGFAGVGFAAPLLAYRIFPATPSGGCDSSSTSAQCSTTDVDEASAINDAVSHGAKVINLSLGATPPCSDPTEENAVEAAIARGVVVVAAAGNESKNGLDCPAAYPGVIAVGAEGPGGSSDAEIVASYSNWLNNGGTGSGGAYLVAPGGTASSSTDSDSLHYVENITSSQQSGASAYCKVDAFGEASDCRAGFAGTSQATPHVVGVVSLMLGLRPSLTPAQIAADLCSTAHSIGDSKQGCGRLDAAAAVAKALTQ